jgi:hypothetical protein
MAEFKAGDKVKVIKKHETFSEEMKNYIGKKVTLSERRIICGYWHFEEDDVKYVWHESCFRLVGLNRFKQFIRSIKDKIAMLAFDEWNER